MTRRTCAITRAECLVLAFVLTLSTSASAQVSHQSAPDLQNSSEADRRAEQEREYEANRLGLFVGAEARAKAKSTGQWTLAYVGKDMKPLEGTAFYEKIGRPDLVRDYELRKGLKGLLFVTGGVLMAGGVLFTLATIPFDSGTNCRPGDFVCFSPNAFRPPWWLGVGLLAGGTGLIVWGAVINPNPVNEIEARHLVDGYNQRLRNRLGLSSEPKSTSEQRPAVRVVVAPIVSNSGAGLSMQLSF